MTLGLPFRSLLEAVVDNRGRSCPTASAGIPLIATNCVKKTVLYSSFEKVRFVSTTAYNSWFRGHPLPRDLIFVLKGNPGQVCLAPDPVGFCIAQHMVAIRADPNKVYPPYLFAALRSDLLQNAILNLHVESLIPHFKKGDFDQLLVPVPDQETQRFVGDTYRRLSEKFELNRRMNETLEAMARAIFKAWFIDFGPTRAKMKGHAPYLSPDFWRLFPDARDDVGMPQGWVTTRLSSIATLVKRGLAPCDFPHELFEHYSLPAFDKGQEPDHALGSTILSNKTIVPPNGVLLSKLNPEIPRVWLPASQSDRRLICSTEFLVFQPRGVVDRYLLAATFTSDMFKQRLEAMVTGTSKSHQRVSPQAVLNMTIVHAPKQISDAFAAIAGPLFDRQIANRSEARTLAAVRDLLLPKLMSGELRFRDAEHVVGALV